LRCSFRIRLKTDAKKIKFALAIETKVVNCSASFDPFMDDAEYQNCDHTIQTLRFMPSRFREKVGPARKFVDF